MKRLAVLSLVMFQGCAAMSLTKSAYDFKRGPATVSPTATLEVTELQRNALSFRFTNRGSTPATILWDESSLVGPDGRAHRVLHDGVRFMDAGLPMAPTMVPQGSTLEESASYADGVRFNGMGWKQAELIWCSNPGSICDTHGQVGKTITLHLTVDQDGKKQQYAYVAQIVEAE